MPGSFVPLARHRCEVLKQVIFTLRIGGFTVCAACVHLMSLIGRELILIWLFFRMSLVDIVYGLFCFPMMRSDQRCQVCFSESYLLTL